MRRQWASALPEGDAQRRSGEAEHSESQLQESAVDLDQLRESGSRRRAI